MRAWVSTHSAMGCVRACVGADSIRHGLIRDLDIVLPKFMLVCMYVCVGAWVSISLCTSDMSKSGVCLRLSACVRGCRLDSPLASRPAYVVSMIFFRS